MTIGKTDSHGNIHAAAGTTDGGAFQTKRAGEPTLAAPLTADITDAPDVAELELGARSVWAKVNEHRKAAVRASADVLRARILQEHPTAMRADYDLLDEGNGPNWVVKAIHAAPDAPEPVLFSLDAGVLPDVDLDGHDFGPDDADILGGEEFGDTLQIDLTAAFPAQDAPSKAVARAHLVLSGYGLEADDEPGSENAETAVSDALTDLMHFARENDLDIQELIGRAERMHTSEVEDPEG